MQLKNQNQNEISFNFSLAFQLLKQMDTIDTARLEKLDELIEAQLQQEITSINDLILKSSYEETQALEARLQAYSGKHKKEIMLTVVKRRLQIANQQLKQQISKLDKINYEHIEHCHMSKLYLAMVIVVILGAVLIVHEFAKHKISTTVTYVKKTNQTQFTLQNYKSRDISSISQQWIRQPLTIADSLFRLVALAIIIGIIIWAFGCNLSFFCKNWNYKGYFEKQTQRLEKTRIQIQSQMI